MIHFLVAIFFLAIPSLESSGWEKDCYSFSHDGLSHLGMSFSLLFCTGTRSFWSKGGVCLLNLDGEGNTGGSWGAVETGGPV